MTASNGKKYEGEFENDLQHGDGAETDISFNKIQCFLTDNPNGSIYRGKWENGLKVGEGTYTAQTRKVGDQFNELKIKVFGY